MHADLTNFLLTTETTKLTDENERYTIFSDGGPQNTHLGQNNYVLYKEKDEDNIIVNFY